MKRTIDYDKFKIFFKYLISNIKYYISYRLNPHAPAARRQA